MANWSLPTADSIYTDFVTEVKDRDLDAAKGLDPAVVTVTNPSTNMIRWNSASNKWQKYDGATWNDLTATYAISISGTAGAVAWGNVTSTPTTLAGYGITDAQGLDADLTAVAGLSTTGLVVRTGAGTATTRSLTQPAAGLTISNSDGVSGSPTFALANDLAALEALASTGIARRTATSTWSAGTLITTGEIDNDQVTYAKIQNVSATDRLLGRSTAGAGDIEEITCTSFARTLLDDAAASNARTTLGVPATAEIIPLSVFDAKGDLVVATAADTAARKAAGSNGTILVPSSGATDGLAWVSAGLAMWNGSIKVEHNVPTTNQMRISLKTAAGADPSASDPVVLGFRSATAGNGDFTTALVTAALSLDVTAGATFGFANSAAGRLYVGAMLNGSAVELFAYQACNSNNIIKGFNEHDLITTTVMSASSDSAQIPYSTTARTNLPWRMVGWFEITTGATAGNWTNAASKIQTMMPGVPRHGDVLQKIYAVSEGGSSTTATSATDVTGASLSITPTSALNRLRLYGDGISTTGSLFASGHSITISTNVSGTFPINDRTLTASASGSNVLMTCGWSHVCMYHPNSVSALTYKIQHRGSGGQTVTTVNVHLTAEEVFS